MLTPEQLAARKGRMTSSVVAGALDLNPWMSPYDAWLKIRGEDSFSGNDATVRGTLLEPACLRHAAEQTGLRLAEAGFVGDRASWSGDSADALLLDAQGDLRAVVEAKTVHMHGDAAWGEPGTDDVPEHVLVQAHWHLLHHPQAMDCYVPVLFGGTFVFRIYCVPRDADFEAFLWSKAKAWHDQHIVGGQMPPIGGSKADKARLLENAPRDWEPPLPMDKKLEALIQARVEADKALKAADRVHALASNRLREAIGEHQGVDAAEMGLSVTYRKNSDGTRTDWQQVARDLGASEALIYRHTRVEPGARVLRVAKKRKMPTVESDNIQKEA